MSGAKHSPAPWGVAEWDSRDKDGAIECGGYQVVDAEGYLISASTVEGATEAEEANVRLIAAAPDLLEALQLAGMSAGFQYMTDETRAVISAAIAKASGESA